MNSYNQKKSGQLVPDEISSLTKLSKAYQIQIVHFRPIILQHDFEESKFQYNRTITL